MNGHGPAGGHAESDPPYAATSYEAGNRNTNATEGGPYAPKASRTTGVSAAPGGTGAHRDSASMVPPRVTLAVEPPWYDRYWAKVKMGNGCWLWTGAVSGRGYGKLGIDGRDIGAHRLAWELAYGPIPAGLFVLHTCDVRRCVNHAHLFLGTAADNTRDMFEKGRQGGTPRLTHCQRGHEFTAANSFIDDEGDRRCRTCKNERNKRNAKTARAKSRAEGAR